MEARQCRLDSRIPKLGHIHLLVLLATLAFCGLLAPRSEAANYQMVLCAANNGSNSFATATNTAWSGNPGGIFNFENYCGPAPFPAGNNAFLRIDENQSGGNAGYSAYGSISWTVPPWVAIIAGGGYTREAYSFNDGWRGRFWVEGWDGSTNNILMQGSGVANGSCGGVCWATCSAFCSHLWPFSGYGDYRRFVFEMTCFRSAGCDRTNFNAVDANTMILTLADRQDSQVWFTGSSTFMQGGWTRGNQNATYAWTENGSGIRNEWIDIDGGRRFTIDHQATGECNRDFWNGVGEFARNFQPCPVAANIGRTYTFNTASVADGAHNMVACTQDYGQWYSGVQSCVGRTIHTDNTPPGKPASLGVSSANPARYLRHFSSSWSLPPNSGSPIAKVHYDIVNDKGEVLIPAQTVSANNPTALSDIEGPASPGPYTLRLWLEDQVGFQGPAAEAAIPHDTTPPAAPQDLHVTGPTTAHWVDKLDVAWRDITDEGSPITAAHYQLLNEKGEALGPPSTVSGEGIEALREVPTPAQRGADTLDVWLSDEEGNVGAPASVALPLDTTPPAAPQDISVTPTTKSRGQEALDVHWRDITDSGSPISAVHYEVFDSKSAVAVPTQTLPGINIASIADLQSPKQAGEYALRMWLSDAEGNSGAPASVPLSYRCVRADTNAASALSVGLGASSAADQVVSEGEGSTLNGALKAPDGSPVAKVPVCVFSRVITDEGREFLGYAMTGSDGSYSFPVAAGPSRELIAVHRRDHRELQSHATLQTVVHPTFKARRRIVYNKHFARFKGQIPGPHNDRVVIVLQARVGKGWTAFRRYRTRSGGRFNLAYRFRHTFRKTRYVMRAQVRQTVGYPYLQGNSSPLKLMVLPSGKHHKAHKKKRHCARHRKGKGSHRAKGKAHSSAASHSKRRSHRRRGCVAKRRAHHKHRRRKHRPKKRHGASRKKGASVQRDAGGAQAAPVPSPSSAGTVPQAGAESGSGTESEPEPVTETEPVAGDVETGIDWQLRNANSAGNPTLVFGYGSPGQKPVVGDWNGDGVATVGTFDPATGIWRLRNKNSVGPPNLAIQYGGGPWTTPVVGDWDGNGTTTIGVVDPSNHNWNLRNSNLPGNPDISFQYGGTSSVPVVGNWDGVGADGIGVYYPGPGVWDLRQGVSGGDPDISFQYGGSQFVPLTGDWNGNRVTTIGVYEPTAGTWALRNSSTGGNPDVYFQYGGSQFTPVSGDWDGNGTDTVGLVTK